MTPPSSASGMNEEQLSVIRTAGLMLHTLTTTFSNQSDAPGAVPAGSVSVWRLTARQAV